jgi:NAD(P)-dependent dehydrogenase (short-subunit alcohol dehydrogenase family)
MTNPVAIVTGGSRGIGAACCRMLAARGYDVAFSYTANDAAAATVSAEIEAAGVQALAIKADMATEDGVLALFTAADGRFGRLDQVVINAGITGRIKRVVDMSVEDIQAVMNLNIVGAMLCARESVKRMSTKSGGKGGNIVIVSSAAAWLGSPNEFVHYAASKGATNSLTIGLAKEVAQEGIRVNAVAPGLIDTDIHATAGAPDRVERLQSMVPMGRGGTAEEVAEAILWLLSNDSRYTTGVILPVSGGR